MRYLTRVALSWLGSGARPAGTVVDTVMLHATAGASLRSSYDYLLGLLRNGKSGDDASYHAGADRDGARLKMVPLARRAWHAGVCFTGVGRDSRDLNAYSVGFAFANRNDGERVTQDQIDSAVEWIQEVKGQFPLRFLTTHAGAAYPRKTDVLAQALTDEQLRLIAQRTGLTYVRGRRP